MRLALLCLILPLIILPLAGAAHADGALRGVYDGLERSVDLDDPASLTAARASLRAVTEDWLESVLPGGPLRGALARSFTPHEIRTLLRRAQREKSEQGERLAAVIENLAVRRDLPGLLIEEGVFSPLIASHRSLLFDIAALALVQGDTRAMVLLLGDAAATEGTAESLASLHWASGLRTLADVVIGSIPFPDDAKAQLGRAEPDIQNVHHERPLGTERIAALKETARSAHDPALRAVAARVLLRSSTADAFEATVSAYEHAHTIHLDEAEWWRVGRIFARLVTKASVPRWARLQALRGTMQFTGMSPRNDPQHAQAAAQRLRTWFAEEDDPLMRGMLLRELPNLAYCFVDMGARRKLAVPAYRALLSDLLQERVGGDPLLQALSIRTAKRLLLELARESAPHWRRDRPLPKPRNTLSPALRSLDAAAVARGLAGVEGTEASRALLADHASDLFRTGAGALFVTEREKGMDLAPDVVAGLIQVLAEHPDPQAIWLAGEILNLAPAPEALDALLKHAERRWNGDIDRIPSIDATRHIGSLATLEKALMFIGDAQRSPWVRLDLMEELLSLAWRESLPSAMRAPVFSRLAKWIAERAPMLDAGLAEIAIETWAGTEVERETEADAALIRRTVRAAIARVPTPGARLRLQASLLR